MSDYIIGGWTQYTNKPAPETFSYVMYGMITNLEGLTSGTPSSPGWSPASTSPPPANGQVMWTYGGAGCTPPNMPTDDNMNAILDATFSQGWAGVDFDDECSMNFPMLINTMGELKAQGKDTSYTFLAGWDYNNPSPGSPGEATNLAVREIAAAGVADRMVLMCYADEMWSMPDIVANVGPAIQRTIDHGVPPQQVILALTPAGLNDENLNYFLDQVISNQIGGLFIWEFPNLDPNDLALIEERLGIV
ncbi:MAG: glycoside hydrolase family 18 protein [Oscillatoria sp. SIO1A7]|nr:glycoside hydrolase family 18 protein [Oscillatoria sp. SIO1A7]